MISGKLPNNTVWWLSTDGLKVWIESKDLEIEKFIEKGFYIARDNIFKDRKYVGELTTSRLESRKYKEAWVIKLDAIIYVYPELIEEINRKEIENKKKKKGTSHKGYKGKKETRRYVADAWPKKEVTIDLKKFLASAPKIDSNVSQEKKETPIIDDTKEDILLKKEETPIIDDKKEDAIIDDKKEDAIIDAKKEDTLDDKKAGPAKDYFDISCQYVSWIKDEIDKNNGKIIISTKNLKAKMGEEYVNMHDMRIIFGLKKILSNLGIIIESGNLKGENIVVMRKVQEVKNVKC